MLLGFDIGGTKSAALIGDADGNVLCRTEIRTSSPADTVRELFAAARGFGMSPTAAGISCGGPLDEEKGLILSPPNLPGWDRVEIARQVEDAFGIPVRLVNDANAGALAEWRFGAGRGTQNMVFLTFGTGLGAGLILGGRLYEGTNGFAGEIGHMRLFPEGPAGYGKEGSFEGFASGSGIAQSARTAAIAAIQRGNPPAYCRSMDALSAVTAKSVAEAAEAGDHLAVEVYRRVGERLGEGLSVLVDLLNPERIVLGGVFMRSEKLLRPSMESAMTRECLPGALAAVRVVSAGLGERIGDLAAISAALYARR